MNDLQGHAVIMFDQEVCVKLVDPYFSTNFNVCDSIDACLEILFTVKDKWTLQEMDHQLSDFLEPDGKLMTVLGKCTRTIKEQSPFDK